MFHSHAYTILIVEDDKDLQIMVAQQLVDDGYAVLLADSGDDALTQLGHRKPDLLLLDVMLPGFLDGRRLLKIIRSSPDPVIAFLPVIMLTAVAAADQVKEAIALGATQYLLKPVDLEVLVARIELVLRHRPPRRSELPTDM